MWAEPAWHSVGREGLAGPAELAHPVLSLLCSLKYLNGVVRDVFTFRVHLELSNGSILGVVCLGVKHDL